MKTFQVSRRSFLKRCTALAAMTGMPFWFVERQLAAAEEKAMKKKPSANDRPAIALIGCGGQGIRDAMSAAADCDVLAVCDLDETHAANAVQKLKVEGKEPPKVYADFRRLLERSDIPLLVHATPDHWHSLINIAAANAKKDVYAEKPLTLTVDEGRQVIAAVRKNKIILQTGTQQRSSQRFRLACELVRNQRIGKLKEANVWLPAGLREGPFKPSPAPEYWDFWQGQTPNVEYVAERCHRTFRFWYAYSGGTMTDWGAHHNDIAYWAIGQLAPRDVESTVLQQPIPGGYDTFSEYEVHYTYPDGIKLNIRTTTDEDFNGAKKKENGQRNGIRFEGTDGWIWVNREQLTASDPALLKTPLPDHAVRLYTSPNHMENFLECARSRKAPICEVETGHRSATMCHLGAISLRTGRKLTWDSANEKFIGDHAKEANAYLKREMRKPYDYSFAG